MLAKHLLSLLFTVAICSAQARNSAFETGVALARRLTQSTAADGGILVPWYEDRSSCATINALDAAPLVDKDNANLGYVLVQQGGANITGEISVLVDLTAHISNMYLASVDALNAQASNVRVSILTEPPDGCPATTPAKAEIRLAADCTRRRASVALPIPTNLFNCSYATPQDFEVTLYLQVAADLSSDTCLPPNGTFYAGSSRSLISPGCSYLTVRAACTPATCVVPISPSGPTSDQQRKTILGVSIGVSVGTSVLLLGILAGVMYLRKREQAALRKLHHPKHSDGSDSGEEFLGSSSDDEYELDFSCKSTAGGGGGAGGVAALFGTGHPTGMGARASVLNLGRASALFSRTPHSVANKQHASVTGTMVETTHGSCTTVTGAWLYHPGEELRQQGVPRFSDKYSDQPLMLSSPNAYASASLLLSPGQGAETVRPPVVSPGGLLYGNPAYGTPPSFSVPLSGYSAATLGTNPHSFIGGGGGGGGSGGGGGGGGDEASQLQRMWAKMVPSGGGAGAAGSDKRPALDVTPAASIPSTASRPAPVVPVTPGGGRRASAALLADLGYGAPPPTTRRVANPADLCDPELVPENSCSFINPLAVMYGGGAAAHGREGRIMPPPPSRVVMPVPAPPVLFSPPRTRAASEAAPASGASVALASITGWAAVRHSASSNLGSAPTGADLASQSEPRCPRGEGAPAGLEEADELVVSEGRRPTAMGVAPMRQESDGRASTATEASFRMLPEVAVLTTMTAHAPPASLAGGGTQQHTAGGGGGAEGAGGAHEASAGGGESRGDPVFGMVLAPAEDTPSQQAAGRS